MGREGRCRQISLVCVGSTRNVPAILGLPPLTGVCFLCLYCSGPWLRYMERALHCVRFQFSGIPQMRGLAWACVLCLPHQSSSSSQELNGRTLPGCGAPYPSVVPASLPVCTSLVRASCVCSRELASSRDLPGQTLRKSLVGNWRPVCSLVRGDVSGAEFSPFPSLLSPASGGGWAGTLQASSSLEFLSPFVLQMAGSVFRPVNFLSLSCYPTI